MLKVDDAKCRSSHCSIAALLVAVHSNGKEEGQSGTTVRAGHEHGTDDAANGEEHPAFTACWYFGRC